MLNTTFYATSTIEGQTYRLSNLARACMMCPSNFPAHTQHLTHTHIHSHTHTTLCFSGTIEGGPEYSSLAWAIAASFRLIAPRVLAMHQDHRKNALSSVVSAWRDFLPISLYKLLLLCPFCHVFRAGQNHTYIRYS